MTKFLDSAGLKYFYGKLKTTFAAASHSHSASNITSGTLPIARGGTGAAKAAEAVKALLGSSAIGSTTKPLYYDGAALKACADSIGGGGIVAQLLEQNGYVKFANGLILQWGITAETIMPTVLFPIAFTSIPTVVGTPINYYSTNNNYFGGNCIINVTTTSFVPRQENTIGGVKAGAIRYIAVGI